MPEEYAPKIRTQKEADDLVLKQYERHIKNKYQWIDQEIADLYRKKSLMFASEGSGGRQKTGILKKELQEVYGLNEVEAVNLLSGYHISDYVNKYERIRTKTPLHLFQKET